MESNNKEKGFHPSPTMRITFGDGKVLTMNRATRRKNKIFNRDLKRTPLPPPNIRKL